MWLSLEQSSKVFRETSIMAKFYILAVPNAFQFQRFGDSSQLKEKESPESPFSSGSVCLIVPLTSLCSHLFTTVRIHSHRSSRRGRIKGNTEKAVRTVKGLHRFEQMLSPKITQPLSDNFARTRRKPSKDKWMPWTPTSRATGRFLKNVDRWRCNCITLKQFSVMLKLSLLLCSTFHMHS